MPRKTNFCRPLMITLLLVQSAAQAQEEPQVAQTIAPSAASPQVSQSDYVPLSQSDYVQYGSTPAVYRFALQNQSQKKPRLIQTGELSLEQKVNLEEDLQVMNSLLIKSISPSAEGASGMGMSSGMSGIGGIGMSGGQIRGQMSGVSLFSPTDALGVTLSGRGHQMEITYIQGFGVIYSYQLAIPLTPTAEQKSNPKAAEESEPENEWDVARQQLFTPRSRSAFLAREASSIPQYNEKAVAKLIEGVKTSLKHTSRIRFPQDSERRILVVFNGIDGGVVTVSGALDAGNVLDTTTYQYADASQQPADSFSGSVADHQLLLPATVAPNDRSARALAPSQTPAASGR